MSSTHLYFRSQVGANKPVTVRPTGAGCPFCDRASLTDIEAVDGPIIYLKNKYPVLADTKMMVLIETDQCDGELSTYPKEHLHRLIRFGVARWEEMIASGRFQSVIFYKNHGPLSGGTISHPHMQIVGLEKIDYHGQVKPEHFKGLTIQTKEGVTMNLSTEPRVGFFEFNVILADRNKIDDFADWIQILVHYVLHHFHRNCSSYNLFFYVIDGHLAAKVVPRFITSPLYIGYSLPQISDRGPEVVREIQERYFSCPYQPPKQGEP